LCCRLGFSPGLFVRGLPAGLLLALLLQACAGGPQVQPDDNAALAGGSYQRSLTELLAAADTLPSPEAEARLLRAARLLAALNRQQEAAALLEDLDITELPLELAGGITATLASLLV